MPRVLIDSNLGSIAGYDLNNNFEKVVETSPEVFETFLYSSGGNLVHWMRQAFPEPLELKKSCATESLEYNPEIGPSDIQQVKFSVDSALLYPVVQSDTTNNVKVRSNAMVFTDETTDKNFTMSFWFKTSINTGNLVFLSNFYQEDPQATRFQLRYIGSSRRIRLFFFDGNTSLQYELNHTFDLNAWHHVVISNKEQNNHKKSSDLKATVNGQPHNFTGTNQTNFKTPLGSSNLTEYIAHLNIAGSNFSMAEIAFWNKALSTGEKQAIYHATLEEPNTVRRVYASGITSGSPRLELRDRDHTTGSYPTRLMHGTPGYNGGYPVSFDDSSTILFKNDDELVRPTLLPQSSRWADGNTVSPHIISDIVAPGRTVRGISDAHARFTPGQEMPPFDDTRNDFASSSPFYSEGTAGVLPSEFSARLTSKDSFTISIAPEKNEIHSVYFSTGSSAVNAHPGISYFNFSERKWKALGNTAGQLAGTWTTANQRSRLDYISSDLSIATGSYLAFIPSPYWGVGDPANRNMQSFAEGGGSPGNKDAALGSIGKPTSFAGFPLASKFDPREGETVSLKDYIKGPFLLEKVVIEVSGTLGTFPAYSGSLQDFTGLIQENNRYSAGHGTQFFVLIQNGAAISRELKGSVEYAEGTHPNQALKNQETDFEQKNIRTIAFSANVGSYPSSKYASDSEFFATKLGRAYDAAYPITLNPNGTFNLSSNASYHTGSIRIEKEVSSFAASRKSVVSSYTRNNTTQLQNQMNINKVQLFGESLGGRDLFDISNGRSYVGGFRSSNVSAESLAHGMSSVRTFEYETDENKETSPVLLFPEDRLVIGVANQPIPAIIFANFPNDGVARNEHRCATNFRTTLLPGLGSITFYGSYLNDEKPVPPESPQMLTSEGVHEDVRSSCSTNSSADCLDQFHVEPTLAYSGSMLDSVIYDTYESSLGIITVSHGLDHSLALTLDGKVYALGLNSDGQLGLGINDDNSVNEWTIVNYFVENNINLKKIAAGSKCSFAIDEDGGLWSWGSNVHGQLGLGLLTSNIVNFPTRITNFKYAKRTVAIIPTNESNLVVSNLNYNNIKLKNIAVNGTSNTVIATLENFNPPNDRVLLLPITNYHTYTNIIMWGSNLAQFDFSTLDNQAAVSWNVPYLVPYSRPSRKVKIDNGSIVDSDARLYFDDAISNVDDRTKFDQVSIGQNHGMIVTKLAPSNLVYTFGQNDDGQLGQGNNDTYNNIFQKITSLTGYNGSTTRIISNVSCGTSFSLAVITEANQYFILNYNVKSWGKNDKGQLGIGNTINQNSPQDVSKINLPPGVNADSRHFSLVQAGTSHAIAILPYKNQWGFIVEDEINKKDFLYAWGDNTFCRLGNGTTQQSEVPIKIKEFNETEILINDALAVSNTISSMVRRDEGQYWAWGQGRMGVGAEEQKSGLVPVTVPTKSDLVVTSQRIYQKGSVVSGEVPAQLGSVQRFVRHASSNESYYDSHVPRISNIIAVANVQRKSEPTADAEVFTDTVFLYLPPAAPDPAIHTENANWLFSFPFEPLFSNVPRAANVNSINVVNSADNAAVDSLVISGSGGLEYDKVFLETLRYGGPYPDAPYITPLSYLIKPGTLSKLFYGFGDYGGRVGIDVSALKDGNSMPENFGRTPGDFYYIRESADPERVVKISGFKYGLLNAVPIQRSAVFRYDRFGQFRDMLEQGTDAALYESSNSSGNVEASPFSLMLDQIFDSTSPAANFDRSRLIEPPVYTRFIDRATKQTTDPLSTDSINLSVYATSSLPYFDMRERDRDVVANPLPPRVTIDIA